MAIQIENLGALERKMSVEVPSEQIEKKIDARIKKLMQTTQVDGFRKGKVPYSVVQTRYGKGIFAEIVEETIRDSLKEAFDEAKLTVAGTPRIENLHAEQKENIRYDVFFEVYPTVELKNLQNIQVEKNIVNISEENIDSVIEKLRKREAEWNPVEGRAAQEGDKLFLDVKVESQGAVVDELKRFPTEIGSKTMLAGFEEGLIGTNIGDEVILNLNFPDPYFKAELSGKPAQFTIQVLEILGPELPSDEALLESLGVEGDVGELRKKVREHIEQEAEEFSSSTLKNQLWEKMLQQYQFELPNSMVEEELHRIIHPETPMEDVSHRHDATDAQKQLAEKRIRTGLIITEILKAYNIEINPDRMRAKLEKITSMFQRPEEVMKRYYQNKKLLQEIQWSVLEEQAVDELLKSITVINKEIDYNEIVR